MISIHAPREGSDSSWHLHQITFFDFNPRSPRGERPPILRQIGISLRFQSTLPARGATNLPEYGSAKPVISIHAPREGSDLRQIGISLRNLISIHAPREGSDRLVIIINHPLLHFNPRSPRGERLSNTALRPTRPEISIHAPREGSDSNIAQIFTIRTAILQHGYQTRLVFGTKSIVLNRKKSFKLPVFLREPTGLFMFTSGSRHGRSKNQRVGHIYGGACTDVLNLSLI